MEIDNTTPIDAEAIRDTNYHNGNILQMCNMIHKTIVVENGLNQAVTITCEGSMHSDFSNSFEIASFDVAANTNDYQTCDAYFPYLRQKASCSTAPTSGSVTLHLVRYS